MDKDYIPPPNLEVTLPSTRRSSARLSTHKRADDTSTLGNTQRLHDVLENPELPTHEDNSYLGSAQNELNLKTPNQQIIQPKPQFSNTSQVDETSMDFDQLTSVKETISAQKRRLNELLEHQKILAELNSKINDVHLNIESSTKSKLHSGAVARDQSEKLSRKIQPPRTASREIQPAMYPPEYHQVYSHRYVINQRITEMKNNFSIDESNDPREEVNFFLKSHVK